jgi:hypothetical protein
MVQYFCIGIWARSEASPYRLGVVQTEVDYVDM